MGKKSTTPTAVTGPVVSPEVARAVLWHHGDYNNGVQPGRFVERLLLTMSAADVENRAKLREAYPDYMSAFLAVSQQTWGMDWLQRIARAAV